MGEYASMALTAANAANVFSGEQRQASAVVAQGEYEKSQYDFNSTLASRQAADALERGDLAASRERAATRATIGAGKAAAAAGGAEVDVGSARDVAENTGRMGELDALTIQNNAAREAWGYDVQAENYTAQGRMALFGAQNRAAGLRAQSVGTLLTGAVQTYGLFAEGHPKQPGTRGMRMTGGGE